MQHKHLLFIEVFDKNLESFLKTDNLKNSLVKKIFS